MDKTKKQKFIFGAVVSLVLLILLGNRNCRRLLQAYWEKSRLEEYAQKLTAENKLIKEQIYLYEHEETAVEKIAREELGLTKEGEIEYRIVPRKNYKKNKS